MPSDFAQTSHNIYPIAPLSGWDMGIFSDFEVSCKVQFVMVMLHEVTCYTGLFYKENSLVLPLGKVWHF